MGRRGPVAYRKNPWRLSPGRVPITLRAPRLRLNARANRAGQFALTDTLTFVSRPVAAPRGIIRAAAYVRECTHRIYRSGMRCHVLDEGGAAIGTILPSTRPRGLWNRDPVSVFFHQIFARKFFIKICESWVGSFFRKYSKFNEFSKKARFVEFSMKERVKKGDVCFWNILV